MAAVALFTLQSNNDPLDSQFSFEQQPPIPEAYYLQKIQQPDDNGNLILRVKFYDDPELPEEIILHQFGSGYVLKDNGMGADLVEGDYNYAIILQQDLNLLETDILELENTAFANGGITRFIGHSGEFIEDDEIIAFDFTEFNNFGQVQIYQPILDVTLCDEELKKENSLFITDLSVIEDPARTYQMEHGLHDVNGAPILDQNGDPVLVPEQGNWQGAWTFGTLIKNIANAPTTGTSAKDFLKEWIKLLYQGQTHPATTPKSGFNYIRVPRHSSLVFKHVIQPWLKKINPSLSFSISNWETIWDNQDENDILKFSPFRLMAIVNRFDLKGNGAYRSSIQNAGETRFIYTLINPISGQIPTHDDVSNSGNFPSTGDLDWHGMNLIIEYGNPIATECAAKNFAQQWYDLSGFTLGSNSYLDHLELITNQVILAGLGGAKNMNQSALNQLRTSDKLFDPVRSGAGAGKDWQSQNWEFRQFELGDGSTYLEPAFVTNTPISVNANNPNMTLNLNLQFGSQLNDLWNLSLPENLDVGTPESNADLVNWIYGPTGASFNRTRVKFENHIIPNAMLDLSAILDKETSHYFGLDWTKLPSNIYDPNNFDDTQDIPNLDAKLIRHNISLNTCQGCHAGENKTQISQLRPQGYGKSAVYWQTGQPDGVNEAFDDRFGSNNTAGLGGTATINSHEDNFGQTYDQFFQANEDNSKFEYDNKDDFKQAVSAFLTGRRYRTQNTIHNSNPWDDDEFDHVNVEKAVGYVGIGEELADDKISGLFYVNDPANEAQTIPSGLSPGKGGSFPQKHDKKWGYNELERRKKFLCNFVNRSCNSDPSAVDIVLSLKHIPFALGSH